jgi:hypothetical protein
VRKLRSEGLDSPEGAGGARGGRRAPPREGTRGFGWRHIIGRPAGIQTTSPFSPTGQPPLATQPANKTTKPSRRASFRGPGGPRPPGRPAPPLGRGRRKGGAEPERGGMGGGGCGERAKWWCEKASGKWWWQAIGQAKPSPFEAGGASMGPKKPRCEKRPRVQREKKASGRDQGPRAGARQLPGGGGARSERTRATRTGDPRRGSRRGSTGEPARREAWPEARRAERAEEGWGPPAGRRAGAPVRPLCRADPASAGAPQARTARGGCEARGADAQGTGAPARLRSARRVPKSKKKAAGRDGQGFMGERPRLVAALGAEARAFFPPTNGLGNCKRPPVGGELLRRQSDQDRGKEAITRYDRRPGKL